MKTSQIKSVIDPVTNLLLNMSAGLKPEDLSEEEHKMLVKKFGKNWFGKLDYSESRYKRCPFDNYRD